MMEVVVERPPKLLMPWKRLDPVVTKKLVEKEMKPNKKFCNVVGPTKCKPYMSQGPLCNL